MQAWLSSELEHRKFVLVHLSGLDMVAGVSTTGDFVWSETPSMVTVGIYHTTQTPKQTQEQIVEGPHKNQRMEKTQLITLTRTLKPWSERWPKQYLAIFI